LADVAERTGWSNGVKYIDVNTVPSFFSVLFLFYTFTSGYWCWNLWKRRRRKFV